MSETQKLNQRLDQIEHLLRQHQVRQRRLEPAVEEFRAWREEVLAMARSLEETGKALAKTKKTLESSNSFEERFEQLQKEVKALQKKARE